MLLHHRHRASGYFRAWWLTPEGLPVGIQIVGRHQDDFGVLQLAHVFEQATGHWQMRPSVAAWPVKPLTRGWQPDKKPAGENADEVAARCSRPRYYL